MSKIKISFGIIPFFINENKQIEYVLVSRKYSYNFSDLLLGRWSIDNLNEISELFKNMTLNELQLLQNNDFDNLWKMFWREEKIKKTYNYFIGHLKFEILKIGYFLNNNHISLKKIINKYIHYSIHNKTELSFPKGQQDINLGMNNYIYTALREFQEETGISNYTVYDKIKPYSHFINHNNITYKTLYYFVKINNKNEINNFKRDNNEIDNIIIYNKNNNKLNFKFDFNKIEQIIKSSYIHTLNNIDQDIIKEKLKYFNDIVNNRILYNKNNILTCNNITFKKLYLQVISNINNINSLNNNINNIKNYIKKNINFNKSENQKKKEIDERFLLISFNKFDKQITEKLSNQNLANFFKLRDEDDD